jgi:hypothetical protein
VHLAVSASTLPANREEEREGDGNWSNVVGKERSKEIEIDKDKERGEGGAEEKPTEEDEGELSDLDLEDFIGGPVAVTNSKYATKVEPKAVKVEPAAAVKVEVARVSLKRSIEAIEPVPPPLVKKVAKRRFVVN